MFSNEWSYIINFFPHENPAWLSSVVRVNFFKWIILRFLKSLYHPNSHPHQQPARPFIMHHRPRIERFSPILPTECDYCYWSPWVSPDEVSDIKHVAIDNNPAIARFIVLSHHKASHNRDCCDASSSILLVNRWMWFCWGDRFGTCICCKFFRKKSCCKKDCWNQKSFHH